MFPRVVQAKHVKDHIVWLKFDDGSAGEVDLSEELHGEVFEPLKDVCVFKRFTLEGHTLAWSTGADFAPEFLKARLLQIAP